jgi:hypothetical protein
MNDTRGVRNRLLFAKRRLDELTKMGGGDFGIVPEIERQQPLQEFFFHLVGAIEFLAQTINDARQLINDEEDVTPGGLCQKLSTGDPLGTILSLLHPQTRHKQLPTDPYSEEGSHFRIILLRNRVCHHNRNPFHFRRGSEPPCSLFLDPRDRQEKKGSYKPAIEELTLFWKLVNDKCEYILSTY